MSFRTCCRTSLWVVLPAAIGCSTASRFDSQTESGSLRVALEAGGVPHDVTAIRFDVVGAADACDAPAIASRTLGLESEALADREAGATGQRGQHAFSDALFLLDPGAYHVCVTPLAGEAPSVACSPTDAGATVTAATTQEIVLVLQCQSPQSGALDVAAQLNGQPQIGALAITPSKFISTCEEARVGIEATDPDGDELTYAFAVLDGPGGEKLTAEGSTASFFGPAGDYTLQVTVSDIHGAQAQLSFPIHVASAECAVPAAVAEIFAARCAPCHTERASGSLSLASDVAAYANLVNRSAAGNGCMQATRVIPGDAADSYLIAKLRNLPGICGTPMPRNQPQLPEEELQAIEGWINGLPH